MKMLNGRIRSAVLVFAMWIANVKAQNATWPQTSPPPLHPTIAQDVLNCRLIVMWTEFLKPGGDFGHKMSMECLPLDSHSDMTYSLTLPQEFLDSHPGLDNGSTVVSIPHGRIEDYTITYPQDAEITILVDPRGEHRRLMTKPRTSGKFTVLVVRGAALDNTLTESNVTQRDKVFRPDVLSVASQFRNCSFRKMNMVMAKGPDVKDGVLDIALNMSVATTRSHKFMENELVRQVELRFGRETKLDLIIYCIPWNDDSFLAYAYIGFPRSVYNNAWCGKLSVLMHEIGHNLGLNHAGLNGMPYGDLTGNMGAGSASTIFGPRMCYNAHKNWFLEWYQDRSTTVDVHSGAWSGRLTAFVEYDLTPTVDFVIINVGRLFMQYNRAKSFNSGTRTLKDQVAIVYAENDFTLSWLMGGIAANLGSSVKSVLRYSNFEATGFDLVIEACEHVYGPPDHVRMSIYLDNGIQGSTCHTLLPPSQPVTRSPTYTPSASPSSSPVMTPSGVPSHNPTNSPAPSVHTCKDKPQSFRVSPTRMTNCKILARNVALRRQLCVPGLVAYDICEDTCGKCNFHCEDSRSTTFFVNRPLQNKNCAWLSVRPVWQAKLCIKGNAAYVACPETCGGCPDVVSKP